MNGVDKLITTKYGDPITLSWQSNQSSCELSDTSSSWIKVENFSGSEVVNNLSVGKHNFIITCPYPLTANYAKDEAQVEVLNTSSVSTCTTGFDSLTGFRCGCSSVNGYSFTTGLACGNASNFKPGCTSYSGYSVVDGESCAIN